MPEIEVTLELRATVDISNAGTVFLGDEPMARFVWSRSTAAMHFIEPELPADIVVALETALAAASE